MADSLASANVPSDPSPDHCNSTDPSRPASGEFETSRPTTPGRQSTEPTPSETANTTDKRSSHRATVKECFKKAIGWRPRSLSRSFSRSSSRTAIRHESPQHDGPLVVEKTRGRTSANPADARNSHSTLSSESYPPPGSTSATTVKDEVQPHSILKNGKRKYSGRAPAIDDAATYEYELRECADRLAAEQEAHRQTRADLQEAIRNCMRLHKRLIKAGNKTEFLEQAIVAQEESQSQAGTSHSDCYGGQGSRNWGPGPYPGPAHYAPAPRSGTWLAGGRGPPAPGCHYQKGASPAPDNAAIKAQTKNSSEYRGDTGPRPPLGRFNSPYPATTASASSSPVHDSVISSGPRPSIQPRTPSARREQRITLLEHDLRLLQESNREKEAHIKHVAADTRQAFEELRAASSTAAFLKAEVEHAREECAEMRREMEERSIEKERIMEQFKELEEKLEHWEHEVDEEGGVAVEGEKEEVVGEGKGKEVLDERETLNADA